MTAAHTHTSNAWAVILAAGSGTRLASALAEAGGPQRKQYLELDGVPLFWRSARTFARIQAVQGLVFVFPAEDLERMTGVVAGLYQRDPLGLPWRACAGGARRQDSVRLGLEALDAGVERVLVHDAARPFASAALARRVLSAVAGQGLAAIPGVAVTDTIKRVGANDIIVDTPDRASLRAVQTPQAFCVKPLLEAHARAQAEGWEVTDDAALMERAGHQVVVVPGEEANVKITTPADLELLRPKACAAPRTGWGYDVHRYLTTQGEDDPKALAKARSMMLGGVAIAGAPKVLAHSDGDVLLHALTDALLGIACAGDIGQLFPDTDAAFENMPSAIFVSEALRRVRQAGFVPVHADLTVIAQTPKLAPHKARIAAQVAQLLELPADAVNVKATTEEGLGFTGEKRGLKAVAVVTALPG